MPHPLSRTLTALALAAVLATPLRAEGDGDAGAYLAARVAESQNDFRAAAGWYGKAILADSGNLRLLEGALLSELGNGDFAIAATKGLEAFGLYHKALALASVGDLEGADEILSG
ncbi:MAG: hypothetical protein EAZ40_04985, partial [Rhodobacterales bacterium]